MKNGKYENWVEVLSYREEFEFKYNGNKCSFLNYHEGWVFCCDNKIIGDHYKNNMQLIDDIKLNNKTLRDILLEIDF